MLSNDQIQIKKKSIKIIKRKYSGTNLSLKQHLNKNIHKDIYSLFFDIENSTSKMNKEKRNLSQPKERHKILNIKEEENNIINNKKIEIKNLPKNVMLTSDKILLNKKEIKQITSSDKIIGEKEEDKINKNSNLSLNVYEKNNYRQTNYSNYRTRKCINCNCNCYNCDCNCREFFLKNCLSIISFAIDIAIIVVITRIYKWTDKNPLKNINFGNSNITIDSSTRILENLQKNEFNEESRFFNVSELKEVKHYLRYLDDDCQFLI